MKFCSSDNHNTIVPIPAAPQCQDISVKYLECFSVSISVWVPKLCVQIKGSLMENNSYSIIFNANVSTCCQTFNVSNTPKIVALRTMYDCVCSSSQFKCISVSFVNSFPWYQYAPRYSTEFELGFGHWSFSIQNLSQSGLNGFLLAVYWIFQRGCTVLLSSLLAVLKISVLILSFLMYLDLFANALLMFDLWSNLIQE